MEFLRLPFNNKYILIFGKKQQFSFAFILFFTILQWLSLSVGVFFLVKSFFPREIVKLHHYYSIVGLVFVFFLLKMLFQSIIIYIFDLKSFGTKYIFNRLSYSNYASFIFAVLNFIIIFGFSQNKYFFYFSWLILAYVLVFGFVSFVKMYKISIKNHLLYFILYLCTFEIAPYVFLGYFLSTI